MRLGESSRLAFTMMILIILKMLLNVESLVGLLFLGRGLMLMPLNSSFHLWGINMPSLGNRIVCTGSLSIGVNRATTSELLSITQHV